MPMEKKLEDYVYSANDIVKVAFFFQAEDGIRDRFTWLEFRRVLFRSNALHRSLKYLIAASLFNFNSQLTPS